MPADIDPLKQLIPALYALTLITAGVIVLVSHFQWVRAVPSRLTRRLPYPMWKGSKEAFLMLLVTPFLVQFFLLVFFQAILPRPATEGEGLSWMTVLISSLSLAIATFTAIYAAYHIEKSIRSSSLANHDVSSENPIKGKTPLPHTLLDFSPRPKSLGRSALLAIATLVCCFPLLLIAGIFWHTLLTRLNAMGANIDLSQQSVVMTFLETDNPFALAVLIICAVVVAPTIEEYFYRGCIHRYFRSKSGFLIAAIISSFVFALLHFNYYSFFSLFVLAIALAYIYELSGDIKVPILVHMLFNLNTVVTLLIQKLV